jgi:hypothetical protein
MNYMVSAYIHSSFCIQSYTGNLVDVSQFAQLKVKVFEYMPWEIFTFSERHLHHLLGIFRFTSLVHNICGLTVKDTVICNCTALENVSSIKWFPGQLIRHHWSKAMIFLGSFSNKRSNELSHIGSFLSNRRTFALGGFDTPKVFLSRSLIPLKWWWLEGEFRTLMERKDESSETNSCDPSKLDRTFCRESSHHMFLRVWTLVILVDHVILLCVLIQV